MLTLRSVSNLTETTLRYRAQTVAGIRQDYLQLLTNGTIAMCCLLRLITGASKQQNFVKSIQSQDLNGPFGPTETLLS